VPAALAAPLLLVAMAQAAAPAAELRTVRVSVTDGKGQPLTGLTLTDLALLENGVARDLASVEPDERPVTVAILVDNSEAVGSGYRLNVVDGVLRFLGWLPSGSRFALWSTGDRPTRILELTDDKVAASKALKRTYPIGGNTMLDALVEASRELRKQEEGARNVVVAVTSYGIEFSNRPRERVVDESLGGGTQFAAVQFEPEGGVAENRFDYDYVFEKLTKGSGGAREIVMSAMGVEPALRKLAADFAGQYRLRYATLPELKERKLEVQVARPGARVRVAEAER
jgi:hypothetical protein